MIKSITFISLIITTFVLVLLAGVIYAYQGFLSPTTAPAVQQPSKVQTVDLPVIVPPPTNVPSISPQDAAAEAVTFSNRKDLYSVELADFNGSQTYKVTFSSGDSFFVSLTGQVVGFSQAQPVVAQPAIVAQPTTKPKPVIIYQGPVKKRPTAGHGSSNGGGASASGGGGGGGGGDGGGGDN